LTFNPSLRFEREIVSERERESVIKNFLQREEERTGDSALERIGEFVFVRVSVSAWAASQCEEALLRAASSSWGLERVHKTRSW
jgi:hypothetical protein